MRTLIKESNARLPENESENYNNYQYDLKVKDEEIKALQEQLNKLNVDRRINVKEEKLKNELTIARQELNELRDVVDEKDEKINQLEEQILEYDKDIKAMKREYKLIKQKLENQNTNGKSYVNSTELEILKTELDQTRAELANMKELSDANKEAKVEKICKILRNISSKYTRTLIPLLRNNTDIFGTELSRISFPKARDSLEFIQEWHETCQTLIETLSKEAENIVSIFKTQSSEASQTKELTGELNRLKELYRDMKKELTNALVEYVLAISVGKKKSKKNS